MLEASWVRLLLSIAVLVSVHQQPNPVKTYALRGLVVTEVAHLRRKHLDCKEITITKQGKSKHEPSGYTPD